MLSKLLFASSALATEDCNCNEAHGKYYGDSCGCNPPPKPVGLQCEFEWGDLATMITYDMPYPGSGLNNTGDVTGLVVVKAIDGKNCGCKGTQFERLPGLGCWSVCVQYDVPQSANCATNKADSQNPANRCGAALHRLKFGGTPNDACASASFIGGDFWNNDYTVSTGKPINYNPWQDVWVAAGQNYLSNCNVGIGYDTLGVVGRPFVLNSDTGARTACGTVLAPYFDVTMGGVASFQNTLRYHEGDLVAYFTSSQLLPGADANKLMTGTVILRKLPTRTVGDRTIETEGFTVLMQLDEYTKNPAIPDVANTNGYHVHSAPFAAGAGCASASATGPHYYDSTAVTGNPWQNVRYGSYQRLAFTRDVKTGYTFASNEGRVFILHDETGAQIMCAEIVQAPCTSTGECTSTWNSKPVSYPGMKPDKSNPEGFKGLFGAKAWPKEEGKFGPYTDAFTPGKDGKLPTADQPAIYPGCKDPTKAGCGEMPGPKAEVVV
jgi:hypothetical protein